MFEWILFAQQSFGDNSIAATIIGGFATIITALMKFAPTLETARLRPPNVEAVTLPPNIDDRLRAVESHLVRLEANQQNTSQQVGQLLADLKELFAELRKSKPPGAC